MQIFGRARSAPRSQELVFLDPDDDLSTVRSKLESSSAEEIYVVVPRGSPSLRSPLEFRILGRIANELSSETIIVTGDGDRRRLAEHEGFRTKRSLRTLSHLLLEPGQRSPRIVLPDWVPSAGGLLGPLIPLALALIAFGVFYPSFRVTLMPRATPTSRDIDIVVDPAVRTADPALAILPGEVLSQTFEVSGVLPIAADRTVGQNRARGEIILVSQRPEPLRVSRGSVVAAPGGPRFALDQDVQVTQGTPARAAITAVEPGNAGNVAAAAITVLEIAGAADLQVSNQRPTTGGTDRPARIVTEDERTRLREQLVKQAHDRALFELRARAGTDRSLPEQAVRERVDSEQFDQAPGTEADQLSGRIRLTASATAFHNQRFNELVESILVLGSGPGMKLTGSASIQPPGIMGVDDQKIRLRAHSSAVIVPDLDAREIERDMRFKTVAEARAYLARLGGMAETPRVEIMPDWAPRALRADVIVQAPR